jgi:outer membrane protein TolC
MNHYKIQLFAAVFFLVTVMIYGCATESSINTNLNETEQKAYENWKAQRQKANQADTASTSKIEVQNEPKVENQPVITGQLKLQEAVKLALLYNRDLQLAVEQKTYAKGRVLNSIGVYTPQIDLSANYRRPEKVTSFKINGRQIQIGFFNNYTAQLSITQPIFDEGSYVAASKGARLYDTMKDKNIQATAANTIFKTDKQYLEVLLLKQEYLVKKHQEALSDSMLQNTKTKHNFGTASDFNLLRAKVQLSNDRTDMLRSKNNLEQAKAQLFKIMGISQNSEVALKDTLRYVPQAANEGQAVKKALLNRPDLDAQLLTMKLRKQAVKKAKGAYFPKISAFFRNQWAKPNPFIQTKNDFGRIYNVGIQLDWSLFNLSREGDIKQKKSKVRQQKLQYLNEREQVLYEVHSAVLGMQNTSESIESQSLTLKQAKEGLRLAKIGYQKGTKNQVSVLDARQSFAKAQLNYFRSLRDYELAHLKLLKATGQLRFHVKKKPENMEEVKFKP